MKVISGSDIKKYVAVAVIGILIISQYYSIQILQDIASNRFWDMNIDIMIRLEHIGPLLICGFLSEFCVLIIILIMSIICGIMFNFLPKAIYLYSCIIIYVVITIIEIFSVKGVPTEMLPGKIELWSALFAPKIIIFISALYISRSCYFIGKNIANRYWNPKGQSSTAKKS